MTKVNHTIYKPRYEAYILDTVTDYNGDELPTREAKIEQLFKQFYSEYGYLVPMYGKQPAIAQWLQGLALNIEYYNQDIVDLAVRFGSIDANPSHRLECKVIENYWKFMANIILGMEGQYLSIMSAKIEGAVA